MSPVFRVTFLGHQGWLLSTESTTVLVDPLLTERFGHGGLLGRVFPPRRVDPAAFPPVDAVIITHEHDDHFDIPSLHRIDRSIPVYLSARSSTAAHAVLAHMGFSVHPLHADQTLALGDLRYRTFCVDHGARSQGDEWDVFPFVAYDAAGHGSLVSSIDVAPPPGLLATMRAAVQAAMRATMQGGVPRPGLWAYANNVTNTRFQLARPGPALPDDGEALARVAVRRYERVVQQWGAPQATLVCGGGWSFGDDRAWLDRHAFPLPATGIQAALTAADPEHRVLVPAPGDTLLSRDGRLLPAPAPAGFVRARPRAQWPDRTFAGDGARVTEYAPACGRRSLPPAERAALEHGLGDLARYLYGTPVFRQLCSLPTAGLTTDPTADPGDPTTGEPRPAVGLALRTAEGLLVLRYDPGGCRFVPHPTPEPMTALMSGLECWATDLLALLRGELGPTALCYAGRLRVWNSDPRRLRISPHDLWTFAHPLRRPAAAAALYRRLLDAEPPDAPRVPGRPDREDGLRRPRGAC